MDAYVPEGCRTQAFFALPGTVRGYIATAFKNGIPVPGGQICEKPAFADIAPDALERIKAECASFEGANSRILGEAITIGFDYGAPDITMQVGEDFWLSRNRLGGGFESGLWPEMQGSLLADAARAAGEALLYRAEDGLIRRY